MQFCISYAVYFIVCVQWALDNSTFWTFCDDKWTIYQWTGLMNCQKYALLVFILYFVILQFVFHVFHILCSWHSIIQHFKCSVMMCKWLGFMNSCNYPVLHECLCFVKWNVTDVLLPCYSLTTLNLEQKVKNSFFIFLEISRSLFFTENSNRHRCTKFTIIDIFPLLNTT